MKIRNKKIFAKVLCFILTLSLFFAALPFFALEAGELAGKTVVLYSANLRGNIDVLPQMAALKNNYAAKGSDVILADVGNYLQGTVYAAYDSGKTVIELMSKTGYDVVAIGSHEFDFGTGKVGVEQHEVYYDDDTLGKLLEDAFFSAVSSNIMADNGNDAINAFVPAIRVIMKSGNSIGFFGITDPNTTKQVLETNLSGLAFRSGDEVAAEQVTALADCNLIIGLSNVGTLSSVNGAVIIDVDSDAGLTVAAVIIDNKSGTVESIQKINLANVIPDTTVKDAVDASKTFADKEYPTDTIVKSEVTLNGSITANRSMETNTGDLWTDALRWFATEGGIANYYDEDEIAGGNTGINVPADQIVAIWNGGNLRDYLNSGDVTMKDIKRVLPYPNNVAVIYLTGVQLLELLESATQSLPYTLGTSASNAAFLQVSGIDYSIKTSVAYDAGAPYGRNWYRASSINRVSINGINGKTFEPSATYAVVASNAVANGMDSNYICLEKDAALSTITSAAVTDVVWMYINQKLCGVIGSEYAATQGRITVDTEVDYSDVPASAAYYDDIVYVTQNNLMNGTKNNTFEPNVNMTRADFVTMLYKLAGSPVTDVSTIPFADVANTLPYVKAVSWAYESGVTSGTSSTTFSPDFVVTNEQLAGFIYNYCGSPAVESELMFRDVDNISDWAVSAVKFSTKNEYMAIQSEMFNPHAAATRAAGAAALAQMHKN